MAGILLVGFLLLFAMLGLAWLIAAVLLAGNALAKIPHALESMLDHRAEGCACYLGVRPHTHT